MSSGVVLSDIKDHVQFHEADDDALLTGYLAAAEQHVQNHTRRDFDAEFPDAWPDPVKVAVMLIVGHFYENRTSVVTGTSTSKMPMSSLALLESYRVFN